MAEPSPLTIPTRRQQKSFGGGTSKKHPRQGPKPAVQNLPGTTAEPGKVRKREIRCGPCSEKTGDQKHRHNPSNAGCPSWRSSSGGCNARIGRVITEGAHYHSPPTAKIACKGDRDPCADGDKKEPFTATQWTDATPWPRYASSKPPARTFLPGLRLRR